MFADSTDSYNSEMHYINMLTIEETKTNFNKLNCVIVLDVGQIRIRLASYHSNRVVLVMPPFITSLLTLPVQRRLAYSMADVDPVVRCWAVPCRVCAKFYRWWCGLLFCSSLFFSILLFPTCSSACVYCFSSAQLISELNYGTKLRYAFGCHWGDSWQSLQDREQYSGLDDKEVGRACERDELSFLPSPVRKPHGITG